MGCFHGELLLFLTGISGVNPDPHERPPLALQMFFSPRNADSGFLTAVEMGSAAQCHHIPLCPCAHGLPKGSEGSLGHRGREDGKGGALGHIQASSQVGKTHGALQLPPGFGELKASQTCRWGWGDDTCPEQPDLSCSFSHRSRPAAALLPGGKPGQFGSWMKHH